MRQFVEACHAPGSDAHLKSFDASSVIRPSRKSPIGTIPATKPHNHHLHAALLPSKPEQHPPQNRPRERTSLAMNFPSNWKTHQRQIPNSHLPTHTAPDHQNPHLKHPVISLRHKRYSLSHHSNTKGTPRYHIATPHMPISHPPNQPPHPSPQPHSSPLPAHPLRPSNIHASTTS